MMPIPKKALLPYALGAMAFLTGVTCCQQPAPRPQAPPQQAPAPDPQKVLEEVKQQFAAEGVVLDAKQRTVTIPAVVNEPQDPIEYLLIHKKGKRHEAVFWTRSKPSVINAALLMLGLEPGQNASYVEKEPAPTLEEIEAGADPIVVTPPQGTPLWLTVKWQDADGKPVEHCVADLLLDLSTQEAMSGATWVFLGGRMAQIYRNEPEVYVADMEGNLISTCYFQPANHLATIVHERARDDQNWWLTDLVPPPGTEVSFVFHRDEPVLHQERQRRLRREQVHDLPGEKQTPSSPPPDAPEGRPGAEPNPNPPDAPGIR